MRKSVVHIVCATMLTVIITMLTACDGTRHLTEGEYLLTSVSLESDNPLVKTSDMAPYVRQQANTKWLSMFKVPLGLYSISGSDTTKWINRTLRRIGEKPVVLDAGATARSVSDITTAMNNMGYLNAEVIPDTLVKGRRAKMKYKLHSGVPYTVRKIAYYIEDKRIDSLLRQNNQLLDMHSGQVFSINQLNDNRKRITEFLSNNGYYLFNKEFIHFDLDSSQVNCSVDVTMHLDLYRRNNYQALQNHPVYSINKVTHQVADRNTFKLRRKVLETNTMIKQGDIYRADALQNTYNRFARLQSVKYTNIHFAENPDSMQLDCYVHVSPQKLNSLQFQPEGTNTAGDLGAAASLSFQNRNLFHGSEVLNISGRFAFEAIKGLEGYQGSNYEELGIEASINFPRLIVPWIKDSSHRRSNAVSELLISYNRQNRPEFQRSVFTGVWRYRWNSASLKSQYKLDIIDVNFISMPWISSTFKHDYLDSVSNRNAILRYNYENLLIMKAGISYTWNYRGTTLRLNMESAGNLLNALSKPLKFDKTNEGQYKLLNIAFAQYAKADIDFTRLLRMDERNTLALHARFGVAYPYGNSTILPFEKRYFAGGSNSVRGWSVRGLGPGRYKGKDGRIDFINQTGDIKIEMNAEMRSHLFWKLEGAMFIDAGNIWTIREYEDQPGGQFRIDNFWQEMAVAYGIGFRLNFNYFIIRLDMGMKAVNPAYETSREHYPIISPNFSRDYALHFAVGLPF